MKFSNFQITDDSSLGWGRTWAEVDITTGMFFKKTKRVAICKEYCGSWYFPDTGEYTSLAVDALERAYRIAKKIEPKIND